MIQKIFFLPTLLLLLSCNSTKSTKTVEDNSADSECTELVTAEDFSGIDGCNMMLINEKGEKLLLGQLVPGIKIRNGWKYKIGYATLDGMASICMAEDKMIKINCIELVDDLVKAGDCTPSTKGLDDPMLHILIDAKKLLRIERFEYRESWVYKMNNASKKWLYNCQGIALCGGDIQDISNGFSECFATFRPELKNPKIIFQAEGPQE